MMGRIGRMLVALALTVVVGCGPGSGEPKEPVWGKQPCEHCAMLLSEKGHGAQLVTTQGERLYFDDLGCMVAWSLEHPDAVQRRWVHTVDTKAWLPAETAGYDTSDRTPMGFGFVAVSKPGAVDWAKVTAAVQRKLRSE